MRKNYWKSGALSIFGFYVRRGLNKTKLRISNGQKMEWCKVLDSILRGCMRLARKHTEIYTSFVLSLWIHSTSIAPNDWLNLFKMTSIYNWMRVREQQILWVCVCVCVCIFTLPSYPIGSLKYAPLDSYSLFHLYFRFIFTVCLPTILLFTSYSSVLMCLCGSMLWVRRSHNPCSLDWKWINKKKNSPRLKLPNIMR